MRGIAVLGAVDRSTITVLPVVCGMFTLALVFGYGFVHVVGRR